MTDLQLYNSKKRSKQPFAPIDAANVRMYVCGPTVYDRAHIGNARCVVVFDLLFRLLRYLYGVNNVTYVRNITDVDDKINARATERGCSIAQISKEATDWFHQDMRALNTLEPNHEPHATGYIPQMIDMITRLIERGYAYEAEGHVIFHVKSFDKYGELSRRSTDEMLAGARVEIAPFKRDGMDFVLWKPSEDDLPGWESSWGRGRPGWHIECSAMAEALLGSNFDIHGGGIDLLFPHHENECAQSVCANPDSSFANIWMHNGYLMVEGEKMSKSLGNFVTVRDLLDKGASGAAIRLALLMTHYRQPLDWTDARYNEAFEVCRRWGRIIGSSNGEEEGKLDAQSLAALTNDLNTPELLAHMHMLASLAEEGDKLAANNLRNLASLIGVSLADFVKGEEDTKSSIPSSEREKIEAMITVRDKARLEGDYAMADAIRQRLSAAGIIMQDNAQGTSWSVSSGYDASLIKEEEQ